MNNVKNSIGWADYTWNPVVGCKRECFYCYAKKIYNRFNKTKIPFTEIQFGMNRLFQPCNVKKPSRIFVGSMSDICYWENWQVSNIIDVTKRCPQHTFLFLTKDGNCYSKYDFPKNCWLGITYTKDWEITVRKDNLKFMSIEPLLKSVNMNDFTGIFDWFIVGGLSPNPVHKIEWIDYIVRYCKHCSIPLYIKNNAHYPIEIKEFPKSK